MLTEVNHTVLHIENLPTKKYISDTLTTTKKKEEGGYIN